MIRNILLVLSLASSSAFARNVVEAPPETHFRSYYQIEEPTQPDVEMAFQNPADWMELADKLVNTAVSLMRWELSRAAWPEPKENYDRRKHFGTWLRDHGHGDCLNTRGRVLMRESAVPVHFNRTGCTVETGEWHEPYAGEVHYRASEIQIDHMVPLKNAYVSGAWKWTAQERCAYTNFMSNQFHLVAVSAHENMSKSDNTPDRWMPPNQAYRCEYLKNWLSVKLIWGLIMNPLETQAIKKAYTEAHCDPKQFKLTAAELAEQRRAIDESMAACRSALILEDQTAPVLE